LQLILLALVGAPAAAGDRVLLSGHLYADSDGVMVSTPMASAALDVSEEVTISGKFTLDTISAASWRVDGVSAASPTGDGEVRRAGALGLNWERGVGRADAVFDYSAEPDYTSATMGLAYALDLAQRCTTLSAGWFHTHDTLDPGLSGSDADFPATKDTDSIQVGLAQVLTRSTVASLSWNRITNVGYQADPYYADLIAYAEQAPIYAREELPDNRTRHALSARLDQWLPTRGALHPFVRLYQDDWGVRSVTGEASYAQHIGSLLIASVRYRHYVQTASLWHRDRYDAETFEALEYHALDGKLDDMVSYMGGAQAVFDLEPLRRALRLDAVDRLTVHGTYDRYIQLHDDWTLDAHMGRFGMMTEF